MVLHGRFPDREASPEARLKAVGPERAKDHPGGAEEPRAYKKPIAHLRRRSRP